MNNDNEVKTSDEWTDLRLIDFICDFVSSASRGFTIRKNATGRFLKIRTPVLGPDGVEVVVYVAASQGQPGYYVVTDLSETYVSAKHLYGYMEDTISPDELAEWDRVLSVVLPGAQIDGDTSEISYIVHGSRAGEGVVRAANAFALLAYMFGDSREV